MHITSLYEIIVGSCSLEHHCWFDVLGRCSVGWFCSREELVRVAGLQSSVVENKQPPHTPVNRHPRSFHERNPLMHILSEVTPGTLKSIHWLTYIFKVEIIRRQCSEAQFHHKFLTLTNPDWHMQLHLQRSVWAQFLQPHEAFNFRFQIQTPLPNPQQQTTKLTFQ